MSEQRSFQPFYITGLPRSRTAWLSVAVSDWRVSACLHEPLARVEEVIGLAGMTEQQRGLVPAQLLRMLAALHTPFTGIADTGLAIVAPDLPQLLPGPVLVVWRDPEEVIDSLVEYFGGDRDAHAGGVLLMVERLTAFCERYEHLRVDFDQLSESPTMRSIWNHLLPGVPFQRRRIESLQRLRIDPIPDQLLDGLTDSAHAAALSAMK